MLPQTFQAPNLHHIDLDYVVPSIGSPLLTTTVGLVTLELDLIPPYAYFPPSFLLPWLSLMPQLEKLVIRFRSRISNRDVVEQVLNTPIMTHVTLPNLRRFSFKGVSAYLEELLAWISAPVLSTLRVDFFYQDTHTVPRLLQFMQISENFIFNAVELSFNWSSVQMRVSPTLYLGIQCGGFNFQVASAAQILGTLAPVLSVVEELTLSHVERLELHSEVYSTQWFELLGLFSNVKTLRVQTALVGELSRFLCSEDGVMPLGLLPNLLELQYFGGSSVDDTITPFINQRQTAGHPVRLEVSLIPISLELCPCVACLAATAARPTRPSDKHWYVSISVHLPPAPTAKATSVRSHVREQSGENRQGAGRREDESSRGVAHTRANRRRKG
jgi:hypothetical protein